MSETLKPIIPTRKEIKHKLAIATQELIVSQCVAYIESHPELTPSQIRYFTRENELALSALSALRAKKRG